MGICSSKNVKNKDIKINIPPNSKPIKFTPPIKYGKVIKVYDGDTITIVTNLEYDQKIPYKFSIRLRGIDCPEIRTKDTNEKQIALLAKKYVYNLCFDKIVYIKNIDYDKYGRILADVYINDINIADKLLIMKYAIKYDGKSKPINFDWCKYCYAD